MSFQQVPFFDPLLSYDKNCQEGPFGGFADSMVYPGEGDPQHNIFGQKIFLPFGIPAGPLPNAKFVKEAFNKGFDLPVYKTVRTGPQDCNGFPNIVPVEVEGDLTMEKAAEGLTVADDFSPPIAITNSFGVPSLNPDLWQPDMEAAVGAAGKGQLMVASFQGTNRGEGEAAYIEDHLLGAQLVMETGVRIIELNLSCPNEGKKNLLCYDIPRVVQITSAIKEIIGDIPLWVKMAYFPDDEVLKDFLDKTSPFVQGFSAINTIASEVRNKDGTQALPGKGRLISGVCGAPIHWAGVDMIGRMDKMRASMGKDFKLIGVGGVTTPEDYKRFRDIGADIVMSATGAMWNTDLAREIKNQFLP